MNVSSPERVGAPRWLRPPVVLAVSVVLLAFVVALEWYSNLQFSLGAFYVFPILIAATVLNRWQVVAAAVICVALRSMFTTGLPVVEFWLRAALAMLAYGGIGLLVVEMSRNRRALMAAYARLRLEKEMRWRAEEQVRILVESSPAAIVTLNDRVEVLAANRAAYDALGFDVPGSLVGKCISEYVPIFADALRMKRDGKPVRASASCWARRADGTPFPAATWFSTYGEGPNRHLAGILVDTSEEVRDREREAFRHFAEYNRILAAAVSHEIRNLCSAIRVVAMSLGRKPLIADEPDFGTLSALADSLARIASFGLSSSKHRNQCWADITSVIAQLRVVIEPDWNDIGGAVRTELNGHAPRVHADPQSLLQVFLNLAQNSLRVAQNADQRTLHVSARRENGNVVVSFQDYGPGIPDTSRLFQPFQEGSSGSGMGLYISRTIVRSFGGELDHVPTDSGCRFDVKLVAMEAQPE